MNDRQLRESAMKAGYSIVFSWEWDRSDDIRYRVTVTDDAGESTSAGAHATRDQLRRAESTTNVRDSMSRAANARLLNKMGWDDSASG